MKRRKRTSARTVAGAIRAAGRVQPKSEDASTTTLRPMRTLTTMMLSERGWSRSWPAEPNVVVAVVMAIVWRSIQT